MTMTSDNHNDNHNQANAAARLYFEDVELGDEIGPAELAVSHAQVVEFCSLWGNPAPNRFTDQAEAEQVGLDGPIVPGIMTMALIARVLTDWAGAGVIADLDLVFRGPVPHNRPLYVGIQISDTVQDAAGNRIQCDITMTGPVPDRPYVIGAARLNLPSRAP